MQQVGICAGGGQTGNQTVLEHIGAAAGILADDDACRLVVAVALAQCVVVPAEEATNLVSMVGGQSKLLALYALAGKSVACCSPRRGSLFEQHSHVNTWLIVLNRTDDFYLSSFIYINSLKRIARLSFSDRIYSAFGHCTVCHLISGSSN